MDRIIKRTREMCREKAQRINKREIISFESAAEILDEIWAFAEFNEQCKQIAGIFGEYESEKVFHAAYFAKLARNDLGGYPKSAKEYIELFTKWIGPRIKINGIVEAGDGINKWLPCNKAAPSGNSILSALRNYNSIRCLKFSTDDIKHNFDVWAEAQPLAAIDDLYKDICTAPEGDTDKEWEAFVGSITSKNNRLVEKAFKHLIWQAKRRIKDPNTTEHDMMIVLFGKTGGGKSVCVRKFLQPISEAGGVWRANFQEIEDIRCAQHFMYSSVAFLDEMEKASKTDINAIKNRITRVCVDYRPMGTNRKESGPQRTVFIGASNKPLTAIIYDDTGMRRFFEVECLDRMDWDTINRIDYDLLWRSVDVDAESPIKGADLQVDQALLAEQRKYRYVSTTEEWIQTRYEDGSRKRNDELATDGIGFAELYKKYKEWEINEKIDHQWDRKSRNAFFNELSTLPTIHHWISIKIKQRKKYLVVKRKPADVVVLYPEDEDDDDEMMQI